MTLDAVLLYLMYPLVLGSYAFTWHVHRCAHRCVEEMYTRLSELSDNHIKHLEERINSLENKQSSVYMVK